MATMQRKIAIWYVLNNENTLNSLIFNKKLLFFLIKYFSLSDTFNTFVFTLSLSAMTLIFVLRALVFALNNCEIFQQSKVN